MCILLVGAPIGADWLLDAECRPGESLEYRTAKEILAAEKPRTLKVGFGGETNDPFKRSCVNAL